MNTPRLLRQRTVSEMTGLPRSTLYLRMDQGTFPKPIKIGTRAIAWPSDVVEQWIRRQLAA